MSENAPLRDWTVMVYFAADNDLEAKALTNTIQMAAVGSTDRVHLLAQLDESAPGNPTIRQFFNGKASMNLEVKKTVGGVVTSETNTGSVEDFLDFVFWATCPEHRAENYLLVLWGHADGVGDDEDDFGASPEEAERIREKYSALVKERAEEERRKAEEAAAAAAAAAPDAAEDPDAAHGETDPSFDRRRFEDRVPATAGGDDVDTGPPGASTVLEAAGADRRPVDALTNSEIKLALEIIEGTILGGKKVSVFGIDACLMSMAEVARQVSDHVEYIVASEEVIPDRSWPYESILRRLRDEPTMKPDALAKLIVDEYVRAYDTELERRVALSACRADRMDDFALALDGLGRVLERLLKNREMRKAVTRARRRTQAFNFRDYVDVFHFCEVLQQALDERRPAAPGAEALASACDEDAGLCREAKDACRRVMEVIKGTGEGGPPAFVLHARTTSRAGGSLANANGVSIYFPPLPPTYADLALSRKAHWDDFLHAYMSAVFVPSRPAPQKGQPGNGKN